PRHHQAHHPRPEQRQADAPGDLPGKGAGKDEAGVGDLDDDTQAPGDKSRGERWYESARPPCMRETPSPRGVSLVRLRVLDHSSSLCRCPWTGPAGLASHVACAGPARRGMCCVCPRPPVRCAAREQPFLAPLEHETASREAPMSMWLGTGRASFLAVWVERAVVTTVPPRCYSQGNTIWRYHSRGAAPQMEVNHTHAVASMRRWYRLIRRYGSQRRATSADGERKAGGTRDTGSRVPSR